MRQSMTNKQRQGSSNFIVQGSILAIASVMVRLIGIVYRIPMTNIIGDEGNGYYAAAYSIYSILLLLSSYSLPVAVSKMVSARAATGQYKNIQRIFRGSLIFASIAGGIFSLLTYFGAEFFATKIVNMPLAAIPLKFMAPTIFIMAILGVFRGYYQGMSTTIPTAFSQIIEQIVNAVVSVSAAYFLFSWGEKTDLVKNTTDYAHAWGATGGTIGTGVGALTALIFCFGVYQIYKRVLRKLIRRDRTEYLEPYSYITKTLLFTIVPVVLSTAVYNLIDIIDNSFFSYYMKNSNAYESYRSIWGAYNGKYLLLIHVPVAFASALAASVVPSISKAVAQNNRGQIVEKVNTTFKYVMLIAIPSAVGLGVLGNPIVKMLFRGDRSEAGLYLMLGSTAVIFFSLSTVTNAILQGINKLKIPVRNSIISLAIHIILLWFLLWQMDTGIYGVVLSYTIFGISMCILNTLAIGKYLTYQQQFIKTYGLPFLASAIMGVMAFFTYKGVYALISSNTISVLCAILMAIVVYAVLIILFGCLDEVDLYDLPKGEKFVRLAKKLHLMK